MYLLLLGPLLEEKYGSLPLLLVMLITALATGLAQLLLFPGALTLGASGIVFAFILMASVTSVRAGELPLTFVLVAALYIAQQLSEMLGGRDSVAYAAHFVGGLVGALAGFCLARKAGREERRYP